LRNTCREAVATGMMDGGGGSMWMGSNYYASTQFDPIMVDLRAHILTTHFDPIVAVFRAHILISHFDPIMDIFGAHILNSF